MAVLPDEPIVFDLFPREQAEAFWKDDKEVMATARPKLDILEPMQTPAGLRWLETSKVPSLDAQGNVRRFVNIYVNGEDIRFLADKETPVKTGDEVSIVPAIAGG